MVPNRAKRLRLNDSLHWSMLLIRFVGTFIVLKVKTDIKLTVKKYIKFVLAFLSCLHIDLLNI